MKITEVEVFLLTAPAEARPHWVSHFVVPTANDMLVRLRTDEGLDGFGLASSNTHLDAAARMFAEGYAELIVGADALAPERFYETLFALTWQRRAQEKGWSRASLVLASAAVDIAAWDLVGGPPAGLILESFTDPEHDPLQAELFENPPAIENGVMRLTEDAGLGLTLSEAAMEKYGKRIA